MSIPGGIEDHPDLRDEKWIKQASKRAKREIRKSRRRARRKKHSGKIVSAISLGVIGAVLFGMHQTGELQKFLPDQVSPPSIGVHLDQPFRGTVAEGWADGEAGIRAPDANPEFAAAYDQVRKFLVTAELDKAMLVNHDPEPLAALVMAGERDWVRESVAEGSLGTRIQKGQQLLPDTPKVDGAMTAATTKPGEVTVKAKYAIAYAFHTDAPQSLTDQTDIISIVRTEYTFTVTADGLSVQDVAGYQFWIACKASKAGFLAPSFTEPHLYDGTDSDAEVNPNAPMPTKGTCKDN